MQGNLTFRQGAGHSVPQFRRSALLLCLIVFPVILLWLWEGMHFFPEYAADAATLLESRLTAVHRLTGWAIPVTASIVFAFGIAQTEPDPRLAATGVVEVRRLWLRRWLPLACIILLLVGLFAFLLSSFEGESSLRVILATLAATSFGMALAFAVVVWSGLSPGGAAAVTLVLLLPALLAPFTGTVAPSVSISPGPLGWLRGEPFQPAFVLHSSITFALAALILTVTLAVPRDARRLTWIAQFGRRQDA